MSICGQIEKFEIFEIPVVFAFFAFAKSCGHIYILKFFQIFYFADFFNQYVFHFLPFASELPRRYAAEIINVRL